MVSRQFILRNVWELPSKVHSIKSYMLQSHRLQLSENAVLNLLLFLVGFLYCLYNKVDLCICQPLFEILCILRIPFSLFVIVAYFNYLKMGKLFLYINILFPCIYVPRLRLLHIVANVAIFAAHTYNAGTFAL